MQFRRSVLFIALSQAMGSVPGLPEGFNTQIMPDGQFGPFSKVDPRKDVWTLDAAAAREVIAEFDARKNDLVVDYEHQTMLTEENGQPAPAAGWIEALVYVAGHGLYAKVKWTEAAAAYIDKDEYRYISPVFVTDKKSGRVKSLLHVALTNAPALDGMAPVALSRLLGADIDSVPTNSQNGVHQMDLLKSLLALFGLKETDTADTVFNTVTALKAKADGHDAEVVALKGKAFDPAKHVTLEDHKKVNDELVALRKTATDAEVIALVDEAIKTRRLTPAQKDWAIKLGQSNATALKEFLADAPEVVPGSTQTGGKGAQGDGKSLTAEELNVCKQLGIKPEDFAKSAANAA